MLFKLLVRDCKHCRALKLLVPGCKPFLECTANVCLEKKKHAYKLYNHNDLVAKGVQEKRTEVLENKVDRM